MFLTNNLLMNLFKNNLIRIKRECLQIILRVKKERS
jgi:hypothetical protein